MSQPYSDLNFKGVHHNGSQNVYDDPWSQNVASQCTEFGRGLGSVIVADAAERDGAVVTWHGPRMAKAEIQGRDVLVVGPSCTESFLSGAIAGDKLLTKHLLTEAGVPTPRGRLAVSEDDAVTAQNELETSVVVKPRYGAMGRGVTVNVEKPKDVRAAYRRAQISNDNVIVEEFIDGAEYRGHGTPKECVAVFERLLPQITGDGTRTVTELVDLKNAVRKFNPNTMTNPIKLDDIANDFLARSGWTPESVVPAGETVTVRDVNGITSGGDSRECLDDAPESVRKVTSASVAAIPGMDWGGADIILRRGTDEAFVMEVNTFASISGSAFPVYGKPRGTADEVWRRIRERSSEVDRQDVPPGLVEPHSLTASHSINTDGTDLGTIFRRALTRRGYALRWHGRSTYTASREQDLLWFAGCLTGADLTRPHRMVNKQNTLRRLLRDWKIPQPPARHAANVAQLRSFVHERREMTMLIPNNSRFDGKDVRILPVEAKVTKDTMAGSASWLVQEYAAGQRYTVVASRRDALVVIARRSSDRVTEEFVDQLSTRAVDAVRAVPELRWGAVQLVVPQLGNKGGILVEGMTHRPVFSPGDHLLAGSFEGFTNLVMEGASQYP